mmetsp:Transcript_23148/g.35843  ORF Transcript_23148/g.35843 Transcript_23148/m.35843 type:complete len:89 (+) Transcript_23148:128-394(+)
MPGGPGDRVSPGASPAIIASRTDWERSKPIASERAKFDPHFTLFLVLGTRDEIFSSGHVGQGLHHRFFQLQVARCFVFCDSLLNFCGT